MHVKQKITSLIACFVSTFFISIFALVFLAYASPDDSQRSAAVAGDSSAQLGLGKHLLEGNQQEKKEGVQWLLKAASQGDPEALNALGRAYKYGHGAIQNEKEALKLFLDAARKGSGAACYELANLYYAGFGVERSNEKAMEWAKKGADLENADSIVFVGDLLRYTRKNFVEAKKWYERAAANKHSKAFERIGDMFEKGDGVTQDYKIALSYYDKMMSLRDPRGYLAASFIVDTPTDKIKLLHMSAMLGETKAMLHLAIMLLHGKDIYQSTDDALGWLEKMANTNAEGAYTAGCQLLQGLNGFVKNPERGIAWLERAAEYGDSRSLIALHFYYEEFGEHKKAHTYIQKYFELYPYSATRQPRYQRAIGKSYLELNDQVNAKKYLRLAADQNDSEAEEILKSLK